MFWIIAKGQASSIARTCLPFILKFKIKLIAACSLLYQLRLEHSNQAVQLTASMNDSMPALI